MSSSFAFLALIIGDLMMPRSPMADIEQSIDACTAVFVEKRFDERRLDAMGWLPHKVNGLLEYPEYLTEYYRKEGLAPTIELTQYAKPDTILSSYSCTIYATVDRKKIEKSKVIRKLKDIWLSRGAFYSHGTRSHVYEDGDLLYTLRAIYLVQGNEAPPAVEIAVFPQRD